MDSFNLKKDKNKKHIIIKRRKKKTDEEQMDNLTFYGQPILNLSNSNTNKKLENHKNININNKKNISLKIPKVNINLFTIENNNKKRISISSEKNNKPITCKVHKSKSKKTKKNMSLNLSDNTKIFNHNSIKSNISFGVNIENIEQIFRKKNISNLNNYNIAQKINLKILDENIDNLIDNKKEVNSKQSLQTCKKEEKAIYKNKNIKLKAYNTINLFNNKLSKQNIYKKKQISQKFSFSKNNTFANTISDISALSTEKVQNHIDTKIYNESLKNRMKNSKIIKYIPNPCGLRNNNRNDLFKKYNYNSINLNLNPSTISSISNQKIKNKSFIDKIYEYG